MFDFLCAPEIQDFIRAHENDDVAKLALVKPPRDDWDYPLILNQIKSRAKARRKIPDWYDFPSSSGIIVFPSPDVMEQASSAACALYKAQIAGDGDFADLTGGAGVDSWAIARAGRSGTVIDMDENTAAILSHNMNVFFGGKLKVHHMTAQDFAAQMAHVKTVIIDPQRRNNARKGLYRFEDLSPDILDLYPVLSGKCERIILKASPMMDIAKALQQLPFCTDVHVVELGGECKEVLYVLDGMGSVHDEIETKRTGTVKISCVSLGFDGSVLHQYSYGFDNENCVDVEYLMPQKYLYEPPVSVLKAGAFKSFAAHYGLKKLHPHSHLYTSDKPVSQPQDFFGKMFEIDAVCTANKKILAEYYPDLRASLTVRNFPENIDILRKKLKLKESSHHRIFATTLCDETRKLVLCRPVN